MTEQERAKSFVASLDRDDRERVHKLSHYLYETALQLAQDHAEASLVEIKELLLAKMRSDFELYWKGYLVESQHGND